MQARPYPGWLETLIHVGHQVRALVRLASGETLGVELSRPQLELLGVNEGDPVRVDISHANVFPEDYAI